MQKNILPNLFSYKKTLSLVLMETTDLSFMGMVEPRLCLGFVFKASGVTRDDLQTLRALS